MANNYSLDFRQQVLKSFNLKRKKINNLKKSVQYIKNQYSISERTLYNWLKKEKDKTLKPKNRTVKKPYKIDVKKLEQLNKDEKENYTLKELGEKLNVSTQAIYYYFVRNKITFKKKSYGIVKVTN